MSEPRDGGVDLWGFERCGLSEDGCPVGGEHSAGELHRRRSGADVVVATPEASRSLDRAQAVAWADAGRRFRALMSDEFGAVWIMRCRSGTPA